jgi:hypothetical protein
MLYSFSKYIPSSLTTNSELLWRGVLLLYKFLKTFGFARKIKGQVCSVLNGQPGIRDYSGICLDLAGAL